MNKIKKLVCMLLVVCFSVAAFPHTFVSATTKERPISFQTEDDRYLTAYTLCGKDATFESEEYIFTEYINDTMKEGEFRLHMNDSGISGQSLDAFNNAFDTGLETRSDTYSGCIFHLESAGDGFYYLYAHGQGDKHYISVDTDGDIDLVKDKSEATKLIVSYY